MDEGDVRGEDEAGDTFRLALFKLVGRLNTELLLVAASGWLWLDEDDTAGSTASSSLNCNQEQVVFLTICCISRLF